MTKPYAQLKEPGFFDIGAGFGRVSDTRDTNDDDAEGLVLSFKAYPLGRWYAEPKNEFLVGPDSESRNTLSLLHQFHSAKAAKARTPPPDLHNNGPPGLDRICPQDPARPKG